MTLTASEQQIQTRLSQHKPDTRHSIEALIKDTPQVIYWLRTKIADQQRGDDVQIARQADESKPPVNIDLIDSADLEVRALAFWCDHFGVEPRGNFHRRNGQIVGLAIPEANQRFRLNGDFPKPWHLCHICAGEWLPLDVDRCHECQRQYGMPDYLGPVDDMVTVLLAALRRNPVPDGMFDDPDYGIEKIRKRNFSRWPQMGTVFTTSRVEDEAIAVAVAKYADGQIALGDW